MTAFKNQRLVQGGNIAPSLKERLNVVYQKMLNDMNNDLQKAMADGSAEETATRNGVKQIIARVYEDMLKSLARDTTVNTVSANSGGSYETEYDRARLVRNGLEWYQSHGQYLPTQVQKLFAEWLRDILTVSNADARDLVFRINDMMNQTSKNGLFQNLFLEEDLFDRSTLIYDALLWFKERGQFLPGNIQELFVGWLEQYQKRLPQDSEFLAERINSMMENNDLYQDFLD
jgi:hypothetical protein